MVLEALETLFWRKRRALGQAFKWKVFHVRNMWSSVMSKLLVLDFLLALDMCCHKVDSLLGPQCQGQRLTRNPRCWNSHGAVRNRHLYEHSLFDSARIIGDAQLDEGTETPFRLGTETSRGWHD